MGIRHHFKGGEGRLPCRQSRSYGSDSPPIWGLSYVTGCIPPPQFRMGPTIKINKKYVNKAKQFNYPKLGDLIFQVNPFGPNASNQTKGNKKARPQTQSNQATEQAKNIGVIKGISLFICALWSPAGKGLTSWLSFVVSSVSLSLSHWYPGSGVVLDCIDS